MTLFEEVPRDRYSQSANKCTLIQLAVRAIIVIAAISVLAWPALYNRGPFLLSDTTAYLRSGDAVVTTLSAVRTVWSDRIDSYVVDGGAEAQPVEAPISEGVAQKVGTHPPLLGRSIYFGFLIYVPAVLFGELSAVFLSSAMIAYVVWLCLSPLEIRSWRWKHALFLASCTFLSFATPAAFVSSTLMPDYLSGVLVIALTLLSFFASQYSLKQKISLAIIVVIACLSHTSNVLILAMLLVVLLCLGGMRFKVSKEVFGIGLAAIMISVGGDALFAKAVKAYTGLEPIRPPFLTARLVADGAGYRLIDQHCDILDFTICRFSDAMPADSDLILWSTDPKNGAFSVADWQTQAKLSEEDTRFAIEVIKRYPLHVMQGSLMSFGKQLSLIDLDYINFAFRESSIDRVPSVVASRIERSKSYNGRMATEPTESLSRFFAAFSILTAMVLFAAWRSNLRNPWIGALLLVFAAFIGNAFISGVLSKPDPRYSMKLIWVVPLVVGFACYGRQRASVNTDSDRTVK